MCLYLLIKINFPVPGLPCRAVLPKAWSSTLAWASRQVWASTQAWASDNYELQLKLELQHKFELKLQLVLQLKLQLQLKLELHYKLEHQLSFNSSWSFNSILNLISRFSFNSSFAKQYVIFDMETTTCSTIACMALKQLVRDSAAASSPANTVKCHTSCCQGLRLLYICISKQHTVVPRYFHCTVSIHLCIWFKLLIVGGRNWFDSVLHQAFWRLDDWKKRMNRRTDTWWTICLGKMDDNPFTLHQTTILPKWMFFQKFSSNHPCRYG